MNIYMTELPRRWLYLILILLLGVMPTSLAAQSFTLSEVLRLLKEHNPSLSGARARQESAEAAMTTARAYPNPELELGGGTSTGIGQGALNGDNELLYLSQPLDLPFVREARAKVAEAGIVSAEQASIALWLIVRAKTEQAFYEILRRQQELAISQEIEALLVQVLDKVRLKVQVGESARYEEVKAEAELSNAVKLRSNAEVLIEDAKSALRALFSGVLPASFEISGVLPEPPPTLPNLAQMREQVLDRQPLLQKQRAEVDKARARLTLEQQLRYPQPTLKAGVERDPGLEQWRVGLVVPLPLWNQRQGPIAEAQAELNNIAAELAQLELTTLRELENAYNRYMIVDRQVKLFESSLLQQAEKALQVAESAYRLGERGILDYFDAQRTYRSVRSDYLNARFERQGALIELRRLNAQDLEG